MSVKTINPYTEEVIKEFEEYSSSKVKSIIEECHKSFTEWKTVSYEERAKLMHRLADVLEEGAEEYGKIITTEMGKPVTQAVQEVKKCALVCRYYADNAADMLKKEHIEADASESYVRFDPLGVILAVMPWNYPFWQVLRFAAPAIMAGNTAVLKHASNVPMSALAIEELFIKAGFPENIFRTLLISSSQVSDVIDNKLVKAATLTGSEYAGKKVAERCGANLKTTVMELGGSDPFIVLGGADIEYATDQAVIGRMQNNGQSCIAAKRFIVVREIAREFTLRLKAKMEAVKIGDPMEEDTFLGPMSRKDLMLELHDQVTASVKAGATLVTGGKPMERKGCFYPPTIIADVKKGMIAYEEELFGPVAIVITVDNEEQAVEVANDTEFGLGASIWTDNTNRAQVLAERIDSGAVFINGITKSDPRLPFGGVKTSGYGRELSHYGIKEFVNIKTVWVK